jgi:hypothetical protein
MNEDVHGAFVIPAGNGRNFRFDGVLLGSSSSQKPNGNRWVEFLLYKSDGGSYILSRVGRSSLYHRPECAVVARNDLRIDRVPAGGVPCDMCRPDVSDGALCPERPRHWAAMFADPGSLIHALERDGDSGRYVTNVAARLVEMAAVRDKEIAEAWMSVRVD